MDRRRAVVQFLSVLFRTHVRGPRERGLVLPRAQVRGMHREASGEVRAGQVQRVRVRVHEARLLGLGGPECDVAGPRRDEDPGGRVDRIAVLGLAGDQCHPVMVEYGILARDVSVSCELSIKTVQV